MTTLGLVQLLFVSLAVVMTGLGLALRIDDFIRLAGRRRAIAAAIGLQMVVLPAVALAIATGFGLPGPLAAGLLLLAATPGSVSANLYSHLFGGNVALNVALTGINTLLCAFTLPIVTAWAMARFLGDGSDVPVQWAKAAQSIGTVLVPVLVGMVIAARAPRVAARLERPVKVLSAIVVVLFSVIAIVREREALAAAFLEIGAAVLLLNVLGIAVGWFGARLAGIERRDAVTVTFQVSVHNAILAIYVAIAVLDRPAIALPAALYSISMNGVALAFGLAVRPRGVSSGSRR